MKALSKLLEDQELIILDSAMGSELQRREEDISLPLWSARSLINNPDTVRQIHIDNIEAGADIITTNTFRTQTRTFEKAKFHLEGLNYSQTAKKLTGRAVNLAKEAVKLCNRNVMVAGCIAPLEDCYSPDLIPDTDELCTEHYEHVKNLVESGVDILLAETMISLKEISAVLNQIHKFDKEYCISILCKSESELFSGEKIKDALKVIEKYSPSAVMVNCIHPKYVEKIILSLKQLTDRPLGVYANIAREDYKDSDEFARTVSEEEYLEYACGWENLGVKIIGGCCGTTPQYIKKISILKEIS